MQQRVELPRRGLGQPAPGVARRLAAERFLQVARVRLRPSPHERQHLRRQSGRVVQAVRTVRIVPWQQQRPQLRRGEAVGVEGGLLQPETAIGAVQVTRHIAPHALPQDEVLRSCRRLDRVRLDEGHLPEDASQGGRAAERRREGAGL